MSARYWERPRPTRKLTWDPGSTGGARGRWAAVRRRGEPRRLLQPSHLRPPFLRPPLLMGRKPPYISGFRPINIGLALVADQGEDVGAAAGVVDGDDAVGEHHRRVGEVGAVDVLGAAVGLQLVTQV